MAFTHTVSKQVVTQGAVHFFNKAYTADGTDRREITVPDSTTDMEVNIDVDVSQIKSIYLHSTKDLLVETNSGGTPIDTLSLIANVPYSWTTDEYFTNTFATDITAIFLTNASGASATFILEVLVDSTI